MKTEPPPCPTSIAKPRFRKLLVGLATIGKNTRKVDTQSTIVSLGSGVHRQERIVLYIGRNGLLRCRVSLG